MDNVSGGSGGDNVGQFPVCVWGGSQIGGGLIQQNRQLKIEEERVVVLREKLANLKSVNLEAQLALGEYLYAAVPVKTQYGLLFRELRGGSIAGGIRSDGISGARKSGGGGGPYGRRCGQIGNGD